MRAYNIGDPKFRYTEKILGTKSLGWAYGGISKMVSIMKHKGRGRSGTFPIYKRRS